MDIKNPVTDSQKVDIIHGNKLRDYRLIKTAELLQTKITVIQKN
jgi:hypothetical protein